MVNFVGYPKIVCRNKPLKKTVQLNKGLPQISESKFEIT